MGGIFSKVPLVSGVLAGIIQYNRSDKIFNVKQAIAGLLAYFIARRLVSARSLLTLPLVLTLAWMAGKSRNMNPMTYTRYLKDHRKLQQEPANVPKICVIGAGFSGLAMCGGLTRWGIPFECFEADSELGGNWFHGVYETVHIISSKKTTEYKDFPMPESYPDFPSKDQVLAYLNAYADHCKIREHIRFNTEVKKVAPCQGEQFEVTFADGTKRIFGGVIVCNGHHWDKRFGGPYPDQSTFTGEVIHSKDYKKPDVLEGKRVLVLGGGNSACDIAAEAARFSKGSHVSHRRGYWFMPRSLAGFPIVEFLDPMMPVALQRIVFPLLLRLVIGRYETYNLQHPDHHFWEHHPTINSELLQFIKLGSITPHPDIKRFCGGKTVEFVDGKKEEFDLIVHATGYHVSLPIFEEGMIKWTQGKGEYQMYPDLLHGNMHPSLKNLFVFGIGQPRYGAGPLLTIGSEAVCRMLKLQSKMDVPIGQLAPWTGMKPLTSYLLDPVEIFNEALRGVEVSWLLPYVAVLAGKSKKSNMTKSVH